ncbi:hypothetical protein [Dactylosporangium sp. CA-233914]|uniref:hypothetical protein n=1 Tax=Dactylosporangium sp. CA-233914 TaxID=3239934 RepID=UPI003D8A75E3
MSKDAAPDAAGGFLQGSVRRLRVRHWIGLAGITGVVAAAAVAVPLMVAPSDGPGDGPAARDAPLSAGVSTERSAEASAPPASSAPTGVPSPTASGSPRPPSPRASAGAGVFKPITIEAEAASNTLTGDADVVSCATCYGGARVRYLGGRSGAKVVVHLNMPVAGRRTLAVDYEVDGHRKVKISINNADPFVHDITGSSWHEPVTIVSDVMIPAGAVDLALYNDEAPGPDIDRITIR